MLPVSTTYQQSPPPYLSNPSCLGEWLKKVTAQSLEYIKGKGEQFMAVESKLQTVTQQYNQLVDLCQDYHRDLLRAKEYFQFVQSIEGSVFLSVFW